MGKFGVLITLFMGITIANLSYAQSDADKARAKELGVEGLNALEVKNYSLAADRFEKAEMMYHAPTLLLGLARAQVGMRKLMEAQKTYQRVIDEKLASNAPGPFVEAQQNAKKELAALEQEIPTVIVKVEGPADYKVDIDGAELPRNSIGNKQWLNPGAHVVHGSAEGYKPIEKKFSIALRGVETIVLRMEEDSAVVPAIVPAPVVAPESTEAPKPEPKPAPQQSTPPKQSEPTKSSGGSVQRVLGYVSLGLGTLSAGAAGVTGFLAWTRHERLVDKCDGSSCPSSEKDTLDEFVNLGNLSTATSIAAGVAISTGVVLLLTAPRSKPTSTGVVPYVGPTSAGLTGRF